jgi:hypothetical protein
LLQLRSIVKHAKKQVYNLYWTLLTASEVNVRRVYYLEFDVINKMLDYSFSMVQRLLVVHKVILTFGVYHFELGLDIPVAGLRKNDKHQTSELLYGPQADVVPLHMPLPTIDDN